MGIIDNFIGLISPGWAVKREAWRQSLHELRNYDAGGYGYNNNNWRASNRSAEQTDTYDRDIIRARARDLERNSDLMNAVISAYKRNVVGAGYSMQAKTRDSELNKEIEKLWNKWGKKRNCDVTGTQSLNQMIRMAVARKKVDGGILFVKRYTDQGTIPFQLQMIEVDELCNDALTPNVKGNRIVGGIEYNAFNRPVGYHIKQYDISGLGEEKPIYIKADDVIFYFSKKRPSQIREMSDMTFTIPRIRDVNEFMHAVSVKERIAACLSVFIKKATPRDGFGRGMVKQAANEYEGKTISPGMIKELNAGDEIQVVNPAGQGSDATSYTKLQQRLIGSGQGISYESISRDMAEATYSSARQGIIEDELTYSEEKELLCELLDEIYETFVIFAVLCGKLDIKDFWDNKDLYLAHEWIQEPKPWIDPNKESEANMIAIKTGQKTFKQISAENGRDWQDQIDDMAEVIAYGKEKGVDMSAVLYGNAVLTEETEEESGK